MSRKLILRICAVITALCLMPAWLGCQDEAPKAGLAVEVLDVGQSDCTLVTQGDTVLMIDAGTANARSLVQGELAERSIERIDYLLLTHPHEDHIGNARMLLELYTVGALILSPFPSDDLGYTMVLDAAAERDIPCHTAYAGDTYALGEATVEILFADGTATEPNNGSVIFRILYGETVFLFTGDAEKKAEETLLASVPAEMLDCDFLKAGHHGSDTSCHEGLLRAATPTHVAISCGKENDYGFPHRELLKRLVAVGAEWHRTDEEGTLRYVGDGVTVTFEGDTETEPAADRFFIKRKERAA